MLVRYIENQFVITFCCAFFCGCEAYDVGMKPLALSVKVRLVASDSDMQLLLETVKHIPMPATLFRNGSLNRIL